MAFGVVLGPTVTASEIAPQIGVVPVEENALLPQRLKVRGDAANARAAAEALDVGADGGVRKAQIV